MKVKVTLVCYRFDDSGRAMKIVIKHHEFNSIGQAREFIDLRKNRWRRIWGYRTKANYWYAGKTMAYVAFNKSSIQYRIKKML